ncbi:MAG: TonB-dependent receptor plug domain-containing protein [Bacteroidota bacterium]
MKKISFLLITVFGLLLVGCSTSKKADDGVDGVPVESRQQNLSLEERLLKTPGVFIQNGEVRIRGGDQSFFASSEPLFEINGQVITGGFNAAKNLVNPIEIRSIRVLKNPDELALYGTRGLNGVVKIRLRNTKGE